MDAHLPEVGVLIVDDHPITRSGLACLVGDMPGYTVVAQAEDGTQAVAEARAHRPGLVLMDLRMPGIDGVEATRRLMRLAEPPLVLAMTAYVVDELGLAALEAGARGFLTKDIRPEALHSAMESVMSGGSPLCSEMFTLLRSRVSAAMPGAASRPVRTLASLSEAERSVLALLGAGMSNAQIARELYLSVSGVKAHVSRLLRKLELDNRTRAAVMAHELGLAAR
ncbi:response regulator [Streptomyces lavendulae]|uniref:response regulator n=1 Tax=Streptomyces lavendulae TaxID=1914 RepID=UPI0037F9C873